MVNLCTERHQSGTGFDDDDLDNCMTSIQQSTVLELEYSDSRRVYSGNKYDHITTVVKTTTMQLSLQRRGGGYSKYILYERNVSYSFSNRLSNLTQN